MEYLNLPNGGVLGFMKLSNHMTYLMVGKITQNDDMTLPLSGIRNCDITVTTADANTANDSQVININGNQLRFTQRLFAGKRYYGWGLLVY